MAKKKVNDEPKVIIRYKIACKYNEYVFAPHNAIERTFFSRMSNSNQESHFVTVEGIECIPTFVYTCHNEGGAYDELFDSICSEKFDLNYQAIRSIWISRLGRVDDYWSYISLTKI